MSTVQPTSADTGAPSVERTTPNWPHWLREPLLHFIVLGALLFVVDHWLNSRTDDPRTIVVDAAVDEEARQVFKSSRGRDPNAEELTALRRVWLDNEVLYREGLALQVDRGDSAIRERVIFKALSVVDANTKLPKYEDNTLREWFEKHRDKYDEPVRFDFQEAVLPGKPSETEVRAFVAELNGTKSGNTQADLRVFKNRPYKNLVLSYGENFAKAMQSVPPRAWTAMQTRDGWRTIRLETLSAGKPADFEALKSVVLQDWTDAIMAEQRSAAVAKLATKYKIVSKVGEQ